MTVINPHNMTRHYVLWGLSVCIMVALVAILYTFQPQPVLPDVTIPTVLKPIAAGLAGVCAVLALSFKYVFAQDLVAWALLEVVGLLGVVLVAVFGYMQWWLVYPIAAFIGLLVLGPYLRFD